MAKFDYKKWVTENKYGKLDEQAGSATVKIRNCGGSSTYTLCLPNASNYDLGHQFKYQTAQGVRTGFLQSIVQQGCSAPGGGFYTNIDTIEDPYVGACANNNTIPSTPSTGSGTTTTTTGSATGSASTGSATGSFGSGNSVICFACVGGTTIQASSSITTGNGGTIDQYNFDSDCNVLNNNQYGNSANYINYQQAAQSSPLFSSFSNYQNAQFADLDWFYGADFMGCDPSGSQGGPMTGSLTGSLDTGSNATGSFGTTGISQFQQPKPQMFKGKPVPKDRRDRRDRGIRNENISINNLTNKENMKLSSLKNIIKEEIELLKEFDNIQQEKKWAKGFKKTVSKFTDQTKKDKFLKKRIQGWNAKLQTAGEKFKKQLKAKIKAAKALEGPIN